MADNGSVKVDLEIHDDYVLHYGAKLERSKVAPTVQPADWRLMWQKIKDQLEKRERQKAQPQVSDFDLLKRMAERG